MRSKYFSPTHETTGSVERLGVIFREFGRKIPP